MSKPAQPFLIQKKIRQRIQRLFYRATKAPYLTANIEAISGAEKSVSSALCVEGRPLGENNAFPECFRPTGEEMRVVALKGSREGCPINTAALGSVLRNWKASLDIVRMLRDEYMKRINVRPPLNYIDLAALSQIGTAVPAFMLRRANSPLSNGELPAQIAGTYKVVAGLNKLANSMIAHAEPLDQIVSAQQLFDHAEKHDIFLSPGRTEACGGPERLILKLLDVVINETPGTVSEIPQEMQRYIPDIDTMADYTVDFIKLNFANRFYRLETEKAVTAARQLCQANNKRDVQVGEQLTAILHTPHTFRIEAIHKTLQFGLKRLGMGKLISQLDRAEPRTCNIAVHSAVSMELQNGIAAMLGHMLNILHLAANHTREQQQLINRHLGKPRTGNVSINIIANNIGIKPVLKIFGLKVRETDHYNYEFRK